MWLKIDDNFCAHDKVRKAWNRDPAAIGLHVMAMSNAARFENDGHVSRQFVRDLLPNPQQRMRVLSVLTSCGLWERNGHDFLIHDFLDWNPSHEQREAERRASRKRQQKHRQRRKKAA